eukprot:1932590-Amphidinium_carterae.1
MGLARLWGKINSLRLQAWENSSNQLFHSGVVRGSAQQQGAVISCGWKERVARGSTRVQFLWT